MLKPGLKTATTKGLLGILFGWIEPYSPGSDAFL